MNETLTLQLDEILKTQAGNPSTHWLQRLGSQSEITTSLCFYNRLPGRLMGVEAAQYLLPRIDPRIQCQALHPDGSLLLAHSPLLHVQAPMGSFLLAEAWLRPLMETLSAITTQISQWEEVLSPHGIRILYRAPFALSPYCALEKQAALAGGARNHRLFLTDGVRLHALHYQWMGSLTEAVNLLLEALPPTIKIETEVTSLGQVQEAIEAGSHMLLLQDMSLAEIKLAVRTCQRRVWVEWVKPFRFPEDVPILVESGVQFVSTTSLLSPLMPWPLCVEVNTPQAVPAGSQIPPIE